MERTVVSKNTYTCWVSPCGDYNESEKAAGRPVAEISYVAHVLPPARHSVDSTFGSITVLMIGGNGT